MDFSLSTPLLERFIAALLIGALVGLEREFSSREEHGTLLFAGIRTFPIISLTGFAAALASDYVAWAFPMTLLVLGALAVAAYYHRARQSGDTGTTTQITAFAVFVLGGLCYWQQLSVAAATAVVLTLLLSYKPVLHRFVAGLEGEDVQALLKFALITVVILPALPNRDLGPFGLINPRTVWLMVVFISAVSFTGYGLGKWLGPRTGIATTGILGGLASSTAVTFSFTERAAENEARIPAYASGIALATTILYPRVILILWVWSPTLLRPLVIPFLILFLAGLAGSIWLWRAPEDRKEGGVPLTNPFKMGPALKFGVIFALILAISRGAWEVLGAQGVYLTGFLAGLEGLDAITLSVGRLVGQSLAVQAAARALLLAVIANTFVKGGIVASGGSDRLTRVLLPFFLVQVIVAALFLFLV